MEFEDFEEIEELCCWNLSFGITIKDTLKSIDRIDLLTLFIDN
tara:strand:+ start:336 stop:464 length:129 start_codon:yes stop_codon:yes gene_type:complete